MSLSVTFNFGNHWQPLWQPLLTTINVGTVTSNFYLTLNNIILLLEQYSPSFKKLVTTFCSIDIEKFCTLKK